MSFSRVALAALFLSGCASAGSMQTAHTNGRGKAQLGIELSEQVLPSRYSVTAYPMVGVSGRVGVSDRVDLGGRIGPSGGELMMKVQLTRPPPSIVVSLAPSSGLWAWYTEGVWLASYNLQLPVLIGIPLRDQHQIVLGPRIHQSIFGASFGTTKGLVANTYVGSSAGIAWKLPVTSTSVRLMPEIAFLYPLAVFVDRTDDVGGLAWFGDKWIVQGNLGFLIGGS
jgi:hypothetical protein